VRELTDTDSIENATSIVKHEKEGVELANVWVMPDGKICFGMPVGEVPRVDASRPSSQK
jgi:hypothetical protein